MARFLRTIPNAHANSRLIPPAVIGAGIVFAPIKTTLVPARESRNSRNESARAPHSKYRGPVIVFAYLAPVVTTVEVKLAYSRRKIQSAAVLRPPTVVNPFVFVPLALPSRVSLAPSKRGRPMSVLARPVWVNPAYAPTGPDVRFAPTRPRISTRSRLQPPTVVNAVVAAAVFTGPQSHLTYSRRGLAKPRLLPPAVVGAGIVFAPVETHLSYSRRGQPKPRLNPPIIPPLSAPIRVTLARIRPAKTHPRLAPPAVVGNGIYFRPISATIVRGRAGHARPTLLPPAVVGAGIVYAPVARHLTYSRRGVPKSKLNPAIIPPLAPPVETKITVELALTERQHTHTLSHLSPPAVVGAGIVFRSLEVELAYSRRGKPRSVLSPPIIPPLARPVETELVVQLAVDSRLQRRQHSRLTPPAVVGNGIYFRPVDVTLVRGRAGHARPHLSPPAVVGNGIYFRGIEVSLAPSKRGKPKSVLSPPIIPPLARPIETELTVRLALADRAHTHTLSRLIPPAVVGNGIYFRPVDTTLVRIKVPARFWKLNPPTVVQSQTVVFFGPHTELTYSKRGHPTHRLAPPAVVGNGIYFRGIAVKLTYSKRGAPRSRLFAPIIPPLARPIRVELAPQPDRRRLQHSRLSAPRVVNAPFVGSPIQTTFAPKPRTFTRSRLLPPVVVNVATQLTLDVHLAYSRRGRPLSVLRSPRVVFAVFVARPLLIRLAPSTDIGRKRIARHTLRPPTVVRLATELTISTTLVRIRPPKRFWQLSDPVVVNPYLAPVVTALRVTLTRITPTPGRHALQAPTVVKSPLICRCDGPPESDWCAGKPSSDFVIEEPDDDWCVQKPDTDFETDIPDDEWEAGKPL